MSQTRQLLATGSGDFKYVLPFSPQRTDLVVQGQVAGQRYRGILQGSPLAKRGGWRRAVAWRIVALVAPWCRRAFALVAARGHVTPKLVAHVPHRRAVAVAVSRRCSSSLASARGTHPAMITLAACHIAALVNKDVASAIRLNRRAAAVPAALWRRPAALRGGRTARADLVHHRHMLFALCLHFALFLFNKSAGNTADRHLGRQEVAPQLVHKRRRALFEKARESNLHLAWVGKLG